MDLKLLDKAFSNPEFWLAVCLGIMVSAVIAFIAQDIWDTCSDVFKEYPDDFLSVINRDIEVGETLYDVEMEREVTFIKQEEDMALVLYQEDSTVFVLREALENLYFID